jgi:hypothetical protein
MVKRSASMELNELIETIKNFVNNGIGINIIIPKIWPSVFRPKLLNLLDLFRFKNGEEIHDRLVNKREHIEDELADVLFFVLRFAQMNDIDLKEALEHKMAKNAVKYPVDKVKGNNKKYNEY